MTATVYVRVRRINPHDDGRRGVAQDIRRERWERLRGKLLLVHAKQVRSKKAECFVWRLTREAEAALGIPTAAPDWWVVCEHQAAPWNRRTSRRRAT